MRAPGLRRSSVRCSPSSRRSNVSSRTRPGSFRASRDSLVEEALRDLEAVSTRDLIRAARALEARYKDDAAGMFRFGGVFRDAPAAAAAGIRGLRGISFAPPSFSPTRVWPGGWRTLPSRSGRTCAKRCECGDPYRNSGRPSASIAARPGLAPAPYCNFPSRSRPMRSRATASGVVPQQEPELRSLCSDAPTS